MRVCPAGMIGRLQAEAALTLLELMIVIGILSFLVAVAVPNFLDWNRKAKLKDAVGLVHANLNMARLNAINQNATATVTVTQTSSSSPVSVTFTGITGLSTLTLDSEVSLTNANGDALGSGVNSPQTIQFNTMGLRLNTGNGNNLCISNTGAGVACSSSTSQAFNFKNSQNVNYRIVVLPTGKISWCYTGSCAG